MDSLEGRFRPEAMNRICPHVVASMGQKAHISVISAPALAWRAGEKMMNGLTHLPATALTWSRSAIGEIAEAVVIVLLFGGRGITGARLNPAVGYPAFGPALGVAFGFQTAPTHFAFFFAASRFRSS